MGGVPRVRFQLVALANWLWRAPAPQKPQRSLAPSRLSLPNREESGLHAEVLRAYVTECWRLYATIIVVRYVPVVLRFFNLHAIVRMVRRIRSRSFLALRILLEICVASAVTMRLDSYRKVMLRRVPMLTARLHRRLRIKGYLSLE